MFSSSFSQTKKRKKKSKVSSYRNSDVFFDPIGIVRSNSGNLSNTFAEKIPAGRKKKKTVFFMISQKILVAPRQRRHPLNLHFFLEGFDVFGAILCAEK